MEITKTLAEFIYETSYEDIPEEVREKGKRIILDSIGCALGGFYIPAGKIIVNTVKNLGGSEESTIIGDGKRTSSFNAAYINCKLANLMDMDDVFWNSAHFSPVVIYPALAIGECNGATGKDFLTAVSLGFEVAARISVAIGPLFDVIEGKVEYVSKGACGFGQHIFGGVTSAGKLLKMSIEDICQAMGIAGFYAPAAISPKTTKDLTMSKYALEWSAAGAVMSTLLVKNGFEGPNNILDDDLFAKAMGKKGYDSALILDGLGKTWYGHTTSLKLYPSCRYNHHALDLFERILDENQLKPDEIEKVNVSGLSRLTMWPWTNTKPQDEFWGEFSLPYNLALMAHRIKPGPEWLNPIYLKDRNILNFCQKINIETHPEMDEILKEGFPASLQKRPTKLEVAARSRIFSASTEIARGDGWLQDAELSDTEIKEKFIENTIRILSTDKIQKIIQNLLKLESISSLEELCILFSDKHC